MKRFVRTQQKKEFTTGAVVITVLCFFVVLAVFLYAMGEVDQGSRQRQEEALQNAVNRDITICYAQEGRYPEDLKYLEDNYGLTWDKKEFSVKYQVVGANIRPYITVIPLGNSGTGFSGFHWGKE